MKLQARKAGIGETGPIVYDDERRRAGGLGDFQKSPYHIAGLFARLRCCGSPNTVYYARVPCLEDEQKSCAIWHDASINRLSRTDLDEGTIDGS